MMFHKFVNGLLRSQISQSAHKINWLIYKQSNLTSKKVSQIPIFIFFLHVMNFLNELFIQSSVISFIHFSADSDNEEEKEDEELPSNFECKKCKKVFNDLADFRSHGKSVHKELVTKRHECLICNAILFDTSRCQFHQRLTYFLRSEKKVP